MVVLFSVSFSLGVLEGHNLEECLGLPLHLICGLSLRFSRSTEKMILYCMCVYAGRRVCECAHMTLCACVCNETCMIAL